jgi:hypothetical protein
MNTEQTFSKPTNELDEVLVKIDYAYLIAHRKYGNAAMNAPAFLTVTGELNALYKKAMKLKADGVEVTKLRKALIDLVDYRAPKELEQYFGSVIHSTPFALR